MEVMNKSRMDKSYKSIDQKSKDISHYGILGMKWGIRKQEGGGVARTGSPQDNSTGYEPKNPGIGEGGEPAKPGSGSRGSMGSKQTPKAKNMSDSELRDRVNRMNLEKQYNQLKAEGSKKTQTGTQKRLKRGGQAVEEILWKSGTTVAQRALTNRLDAGVNKLLTDKFGSVPDITKKK